MKKELASSSEFRTLMQMAFLIFVLYFTNIYSLLFSHFLVEIFGIVISFGIFIVAWNSRRLTDNSFLFIIGVAYLFVGSLDMLHILAHPEFGVLHGSSINMDQQFRIAGRYLESLSFLLALIFLRKKIRPTILFLSYSIIVAALVLSILYWNIFPVAYVEGTGTTLFKKISDYAVLAVLFVSVLFLLKRRKDFDPVVANLLILAIAAKMFSVVIHTPFAGSFSFANIAGNGLRFASYFLLYKAVIEAGLMDPYRVLFKSLKSREILLEKSRLELESRVIERTDDLKKANAELVREIIERARTEENLLESYKHLGVINRRISLLLDLSSGPYKKRKKEALRYILNSAVSLSGATAGILYFRFNRYFLLRSSVGVDKEFEKRVNVLKSSNCSMLKQLIREKKLVKGTPEECSLGESCLLVQNCEYVISLPLTVSQKLKGLIFLSFKDKVSMDSQDMDFLSVFAVNASSALFNTGILK